MANGDIHQPHDKLFKLGLGSPADAAAFLRPHLPVPLANLVSWDALRPEPGSFIDSHMKGGQTDLLFSAPLRGAPDGAPCALVYLLLEHLKEPRRWAALTLLRYMVRIWERHIQCDPPPESLPPIIPVVLLQSGEAGWRMPEQFAGLLDIPAGLSLEARTALLRFVPDFTFRLVQLSALPFDAIAGSPSGILVLRLLKAETLGALMGDEVWDEALLSRVPETLVLAALRYILDRAEVDSETLERKVATLAHQAIRSTAMSLAEQLVQKGRQEGLEKGRLEGRQEGQTLSLQAAVLDVLETRFPPLPDALREEITALSDPEQLRRLLRHAATCADLEAFADAL